MLVYLKSKIGRCVLSILTLSIFFCFHVYGTAQNIPTRWWYMGFNYESDRLTTIGSENLNQRIQKNEGWTKIASYIDLANYYWIQRRLDSMLLTLDNCDAYAQKNLSVDTYDVFAQRLINMRRERLLNAAQWENALKFTEMEIPSNDLVEKDLHEFYVHKILAKGNIMPLDQDEIALNGLLGRFMQNGYYEKAIDVADFLYIRSMLDSATYSKLAYSMPYPYSLYALTERYIFSGELDKLPELNSRIPENYYLAKFRSGIYPATVAINDGQVDKALQYLSICKKAALSMADADVDEHYNHIASLLIQSGNISKMVADTLRIQDAYLWRLNDKITAYANYSVGRVNAISMQLTKQRNIGYGLAVATSILLVVSLFFILRYNDALKALAKLNGFRTHFIYAISHDIRAHVNEIERTAELQQNTEPLISELRFMLDDTLLWAHSAQKQEMIHVVMSINKLLEDVLESMEQLISHHQIELTVTNTQQVQLKCHPEGVKVLMRNLILNGIKHNRPQGQLKVDLQADRLVITNTTLKTNLRETSMGSHLIRYFADIDSFNVELKIVDSWATATCRWS